MLFQKQKYLHRPSEGTIGDCHRTAIACFLDMPRDRVPHYGLISMEDGQLLHRLFDEWLSHRGWVMAWLNLQADSVENALRFMAITNPNVYYLFGGISRNGSAHTVIARGGEIVWDPSLDDAGIVSSLEGDIFQVQFLTKYHKHIGPIAQR